MSRRHAAVRAPSAGSANGRHAVQHPENTGYALVWKGGSWLFTYEGDPVTAGDTEGMRVIALLLSHRGRAYTAADIEAELGVVDPDLLARSGDIDADAMAGGRYESGGKILTSTVAHGLQALPTTVLDRAPGMADFATFVEACAPALGWEPGSFLDALEGNRRRADAIAIEALPVGAALLVFFGERDIWTGTASQLLTALGELVTEEVRKERAWPKQANRFSNQLKRLAPNLRRAGLTYVQDRQPGTGERVLVFARDKEAWDRHHRHTTHEPGDEAASQHGEGSSHHRHTPPPVPAAAVRAEPDCDGCDDRDDGWADIQKTSTAGEDAAEQAALEEFDL